MKAQNDSRLASAVDGWFPVELSRHVPQGEVVQTMLHGQELALWRSADGKVQAWENRCPHRSVRLTLGFVADDQLVCRYHGWRYGNDGRCTGVPSTPALAPPPAACVRAYACREAGGIVWASLAPMPPGYPPLLSDLQDCRSFTLDAASQFLEGPFIEAGFVAQVHPAVWREQGDASDRATLLVQPMDAGTTIVHLFIDLPADSSGEAAIGDPRRLAATRRMKPLFANVARTTHHVRESAHAQ
jgi:nitrite reductase/ring-hydroxylating ferredoxin subunit